jgi:hypothetical protein
MSWFEAALSTVQYWCEVINVAVLLMTVLCAMHSLIRMYAFELVCIHMDGVLQLLV